MQGFAARAVLAFLVVAPAALGLWLVGFEISVWGVRPGRGLIVVLVGLSVLAWLRRADVLAEADKWLDPYKRARSREWRDHWQEDILPGYQWVLERAQELADKGMNYDDAHAQAGDELPDEFRLCPDCHARTVRCKCGQP